MQKQKRPGVQTPRGEVVKVNLTLGVQTSKRLFVSAVMSGRTASAIVEELIETGLRSWSMPSDLTNRVKSRLQVDSANPDAGVESPAEIAA